MLRAAWLKTIVHLIPMLSTRDICVPELAQRLGCSIPYAQRLIRTGRVRGRKTARGWVTTLEALEAYRVKRAAATPGPSSGAAESVAPRR